MKKPRSILKKLFPAPVLSLMLIFIWLALNESLDPGNLLLAIFLGWVIPVFTAPLRPNPVKMSHPLIAAKLFCRVLKDVVISNLKVAYGSARFGRKKPSGDFIKVPLELKDPIGLTVLSMICTVIPGTIWSELALNRSAVLLHVFDLQNPQAEIEHFKACYEQPLLEIFG